MAANGSNSSMAHVGAPTPGSGVGMVPGLGGAGMSLPGAPGLHNGAPQGGAYPALGGPGAPGGYYGNPAGVPGGQPGQGPGLIAGGLTPQQGGPGAAPGAPGALPPGPGGAPQQPPQQPGQMQQAHAIHYVTKIRNRFSTEPDTYRYACASVTDLSLRLCWLVLCQCLPIW
jgi:histone deacetylase complex regulatory component SIN3